MSATGAFADSGCRDAIHGVWERLAELWGHLGPPDRVPSV